MPYTDLAAITASTTLGEAMSQTTNRPDFEAAHLPATLQGNERKVREGFWNKLARSLARVPFARQAVAAYYCALDPQTPLKVKGILLAALAYFIMPIDIIPDLLLGVGFTDDLTVLATAIGLIRAHLRADHYERADAALARLRRGEMPE